jgi:hypothetical protein
LIFLAFLSDGELEASLSTECHRACTSRPSLMVFTTIATDLSPVLDTQNQSRRSSFDCQKIGKPNTASHPCNLINPSIASTVIVYTRFFIYQGLHGWDYCFRLDIVLLVSVMQSWCAAMAGRSKKEEEMETDTERNGFKCWNRGRI